MLSRILLGTLFGMLSGVHGQEIRFCLPSLWVLLVPKVLFLTFSHIFLVAFDHFIRGFTLLMRPLRV